MAWWSREVVPRREVEVPIGGLVIESLPETLGDGQMADGARGFLDIHLLDGVQVDVYRLGGATADALRALDATPYATVSAAGVSAIEWPSPPPPFLQTRLVLQRATGAHLVGLRVLRTCRAASL